MTYSWPTPNEFNKKNGWTICPEFLETIEKQLNESVGLEGIEEVLLALNKLNTEYKPKLI